MSYSIATAELQYSNYRAALQFSSSGAWRCDAHMARLLRLFLTFYFIDTRVQKVAKSVTLYAYIYKSSNSSSSVRMASLDQ